MNYKLFCRLRYRDRLMRQVLVYEEIEDRDTSMEIEMENDRYRVI